MRIYIICCIILTALFTTAPLPANARGGNMSIEAYEKHQAEELVRYKKQLEEEQKQSKSAPLEQVKMFGIEENSVRWGNPKSGSFGGGYRSPFFLAEKEINTWLRSHPSVKIVRVVPAGQTVLVFYRNY